MTMDINKVAAINTDAGFDIPDLKQSLAEMNAAEQGRHESPGVVSTLMNVIKNHPDVIHEMEVSHG